MAKIRKTHIPLMKKHFGRTNWNGIRTFQFKRISQCPAFCTILLCAGVPTYIAQEKASTLFYCAYTGKDT